jgi:hypothetical protein
MFIVSNEFKKEHKKTLKEFKEKCYFISYDKLKKNFHQYEDKRNLLKEFSLFFCERKISPLLAPLLGKKFFDKNRFPYPVDLA